MKSFLNFVVFAVLSVVALLITPTNANDFDAGSSMTINPDHQSGRVYAWGNGGNAVTDNIQSSTSLWPDRDNEGNLVVYLNTSMYASGYFGNPSDTGPLIQILSSGLGLTSDVGQRYTTVRFENREWEFIDSINAQIIGRARLNFSNNHTQMDGSIWAQMNATGAIPYQSSANFQVYEEGHPEWLPDWSVSFNATWLVTSEMRLVPAPGATALLGLGGLVAFRRRR